MSRTQNCSTIDNMKKLLLLTLFMSFPTIASADFDKDLYFGLRDNSDVNSLQEFLKKENLYDGPVTGGFFSLTREAVKKFQEREKISPAAGFFGRLTRARANALVSSVPPGEESVASIGAQIAILQQKLMELQEKLKAEQAAVKPAIPAESQTPEPVKVKKLIINGGADMLFPEGTEASIKLGSITLTNQTEAEVFLNQISLKITDKMDSTLNRSKNVFFVLRKGETTADAEISKTKFTFNSNDPISSLTGPNIANINLSLPEALKPGETKIFGFWLDSLQHVVRGTLDIEFVTFLTTSMVDSEGTFRFRLTK